MKKSKRIICILISLAMVLNVFTILPTTADADVEEDSLISYVDRQWNASEMKVESSIKYVNEDTVTEFSSNLEYLDTWYLVRGNFNVTHRLYVWGSATLILADGARMYCKDGINVSKGNTLNIYCQEGESGGLYCDADTNDNAAIGADNEAGGCGTINIYGGDITADTDDLGTDGAGIGGGDEGNGGIVSIYGGNVTAIGGKYGAGIGGGDADEVGGLGGMTFIYGGTVNAVGGRHAAGIGGGEEGDGIVVEIWGGVVNATGGDGAAAIGGGFEGDGGTITIGGGEVTATVSGDGAAIGGGREGDCGTITISGGKVSATGWRTGAAIGSGYASDMKGTITITGGEVTAINGDFISDNHTGGAAIGAGEAGGLFEEGRGNVTGKITITGGTVTAVIPHTSGEYPAAAIGYGDGGSKDSVEIGVFLRVIAGSDERFAILKFITEQQEAFHRSYVIICPCTEHMFNLTTYIDNAQTHSYHCYYCGGIIEDQIYPHEIKILKWKWDDDCSSAVASVRCEECGYEGDITASGDQIRDEIIDTESGKCIVTASITINGVEYSDSLNKYKTYCVDLNGDVRQAYADNKITADTNNLTSGWYFVADDITDSSRISCNGDINLILCDGVTFNIPAGITVNKGNSLTIWGQTEGTGKLIITSPPIGFAGIGGNGTDSGQITINGGTITAKAADANDTKRFSGAAGIGGGQDGSGKVTINGGTVNATGGSYHYTTAYHHWVFHVLEIYMGGAGIGGGARGGDSLVVINGGDIIAQGGILGAGIGGGGEYNNGRVHQVDIDYLDDIDYLEKLPEPLNYNSKHEVIINGGSVKAYGGERGAGIGTGENAYKEEGVVTINGGIIIAEGDKQAAAIGGGKRNKGIVTVNGGDITALSGGIGSGWDESRKGSVTLGYGDDGVSIYSPEYHNTDITLAKPFTDGTNTYEAKEYGSENEDTFKDKTIYRLGAFMVEWKNYDGTLLQKNYMMPGTIPVYTGEKPARLSELYYDYSFTGWTPEILAATENASYTAQFETTPKVLIFEGLRHGKVTSNPEITKPGDTVTLDLKPKTSSHFEKIQAYTIIPDRTPVPLTALSGSDEERYLQLVDGDINTKWYVPFDGSNYVIFKADERVTMGAYVLTTADDTKDYGGRNWKNWKIYGANFGSDSEAVHDSEKWQEITSVVNDARLPAADFTQVEYLLGEAAAPYQYYKIEVTGKGESDQFGNNIQMAEFTMFDHSLGEPVELSGSGGTRTFTMPDGPVFVSAEFVHEPVFVGYNLSLDGDIGLVYYLDIADEEAENNSVEFNWSYIDGGELKSKSHTCEVEKDEEDGLYIAVCPVSAAEMVYGINASINVNGETFTDNYAVFRFADTILTGEGFAKSYIELLNSRGSNGEEKLGQLRTLMKTMLDYGSYAQIYFDRAPELLVNSEFVTDDPASPYYYVPDEVTSDMIHTEASDMSAGLEAYGLEYAGSTLVYLSKTSLRHYYKITDLAKFFEVTDVIFDGQSTPWVFKDDLI